MIDQKKKQKILEEVYQGTLTPKMLQNIYWSIIGERRAKK